MSSLSALITAAFVVVEPASMPRNTGPFARLISPLAIFAEACLFLNSSSSFSSLKRGCRYFVSDTASGSAFLILSTRDERLTTGSLSARRAAPRATKYFAFSGKIMFSSLRLSVSMNLLRSSERYSSGPPRKATLPLIGCPHARPEII